MINKYCTYIWKSRLRKQIRCTKCGNTRYTKHDELARCFRLCGKEGPSGRWRPPTKLGDFVANGLASVGISKRRYVQFLVFFYLRKPSKSCGNCSRRQEQLNQLGDWLTLRWLRLVAALRRLVERLPKL